ncbi:MULTISPECIES: DUF262 domain-containing protein [unclassified Chryseobacterium]|uniref:DUF262 domain-containing protein n=1 Tax=unclassified Chryseobacterium TaxID=2593645 RepID=UPI00100ADE4E|nr:MULTISPECIES: DUF262 domain-containing protein [unclassified Chryseobacterium]RXM52583.1 hypothetical protein BOQ64_06890 [Chryseobacterium sp. CH25]RXM66639.1 hypothetical protein BOQ60_01365 [Chryseobacterium sp. CH1]
MKQSEKLIIEIEQKRTEFKTENYPMSIGELVNLFEKGEILINPDFQRYFRWTNSQKSRLIESILLGIPVPSIFVFQREDGIWEVVDGLQRISTLLQFMSDLPEAEDIPKKERLKLEGTKYLPSLEGMVWEYKNDGDLEIPSSLKLFIKRSKLNFSIILSDSGPNAKFDVFQRLNTGGTYASDQEVRNSVMIMVNKPTFTWFKELASDNNFVETIALTERLFEEQYPMELVLRHIALSHYTYSPKKELSDFFDEIVEKVLIDTTFDYVGIKDKFFKTFELLNQLFGDNVFKRFDGQNFKGKFLESAFEAISVGVSSNLDNYQLPDDIDFIKQKIKDLHTQSTFQRFTGSGSNARTRIPNIIPFAKDYFRK